MSFVLKFNILSLSFFCLLTIYQNIYVFALKCLERLIYFFIFFLGGSFISTK